MTSAVVSSTLKLIFNQWLPCPIKRTVCYLSPSYWSSFGSSELRMQHLQGSALFGSHQIRTRVKQYFARPSEIKRIGRHGWKARMSTYGGRRIIMRRILKGRHVLTH